MEATTAPRPNIHAIPTLFRGKKFRSRLEARWSAFLDSCGWKWDYESLDLLGYIPDFIVHLHKPLLLEVKPAMALEELDAAKAKIVESGWDGEAVIVGARLFDGWGADSAIGVIGERPMIEGVSEWSWDMCELFLCRICNGPSVCPTGGAWICRACGGYEGDQHIDQEACRARHLWDFAGNELQWKPKRA